MRVSSVIKILCVCFVVVLFVVVVVARGMFKRKFPIESLNPQRAGRESCISKSSEYT